MRVCGSGAFFGWWGWFRNKELGRFMMYAGNLDKLIYVELINGKKYVFSCDDPQTMAAAVLDARGFSADALQR